MKSFHNTTNEIGNQLQIFTQKAENQESEILEYFYNKKKASASEAWQSFKHYPITSVRRSITNLTKQGFLEKTQDKKIGIYGKPEYIWKIAVL
jgi:predicted transcriptional regulator